MITIKIKKEHPDVSTIPTRAFSSDAGLDMYAYINSPEGIKIHPGETIMIGTGISMSIPTGYFGGIFARSGLSTKEGLRPANCVGVVDAGYRNEIMVALHNDSNEIRTVINGQRIAQIIILPVLDVNLTEVNELDETDRGANGFGSSGT